VCRYCEAINNPENPVKLFNVVPICKMKRHFVAIDTWSLFGIMKEVGLVHGNSKDFVDLADDHWRSLFKIEKLQGKDNKFAQSIESDGISLCVHFQRPKPAASETHANKFKVQPDDVVVGNDPGRINIFYMVVPLESGFKTFVLTRRQYYSESGINKVIKRSNTWNQAVKTQLDALSCVSTKGVSVDAHLAYLEVYRSHREALWDEYLRPRWARQRLSTYAGKQRVFARFFNRVNKDLREAFPDKRIVIAYGSAKFASGGPNEVSVPTSRAYKECATRFSTVVTPEFRTSKVYNVNDELLHKVAVKGAHHALRGVLWSVTRRRFVSRDLNAAINIRRKLVDQPAILNPKNANGPLKQRIRKRINPR
jgi:hypothetical protein